jgi:two-component system chemotaxis response regulator CheY
MNARTILIVDDEPPIRAMLRRLFLEAGYRVYEAGDGMEALQRAQETRFDAIIIDFAIPGLLGSEVVQQLRKRPGYQTTPIFVMSGDHAELADMPQMPYGPTYHLQKPMMLEQVLAQVSQACGRSD